MSQSCLEILLKLYPYVDGELSPCEADEVRRHFELCPPCAPALAYVRSYQNAVQRAADAQEGAPRDLRVRIAELLRAEADQT